MRGAFRLGRLFGIDVAVDWSWSFIFLLMAWNLTVVFQSWHPAWGGFGCFVLAVAATLLFFASVLAHEFAHALVAKSFGMTVREIRLFLFGGVSNIEREPPSPGAEFWMAIVGPLTSFALGILFILFANLTIARVDAIDPWATIASLGPLTTLFFWLGPINLLVGAFNLVPGFPLDGGRVLRAAVWKATGDVHKATLTASFVGRMFGWTLVVLGIAMVFGLRVPFFGQGAVSGIWVAFIGWFLSSAAERSASAMLVHEVLEDVRVAQLMRRRGYAIPVHATVREVVADWFMRSSEHAFPVVDGDTLVGLVCAGDIRKAARDEWDTTPVTAIMTPRAELTVTTPNAEAESAIRKLGELDVDQLPVLDGDRLVGLLSRNDVARWIELHVGSTPHFGAPRHA